MHYHNVFLVRASNKLSALKLTEMFLEPYSENLEVEPYREYLTKGDVETMAEHYKIEPSNTDLLLTKLKGWDGDSGGIDEGKLFYVRTRNQRGCWDWYQWGGRWMWSTLVKDNIDNIVKPGTDYYWNRFHDEEVKGKNWLLALPDGTSMIMDYGDEYPIKSWVDANPEMTEVVDATEKDFSEIIDKLRESAHESVKWWTEQRNAEDQILDMKEWYQNKIDKGYDGWGVDLHFWNITYNNYKYNMDEINTEPEKWFLVNVDLHS